MDERTAETFLGAARISVDLARRPEVAARWAEESACAGMTVGGLAHHLVSQLTNTARLLVAEPHDEAPVSLLEHYERAAWVKADLDDDVNVRIREGADQDAAGGPGALSPLVDDALADLPDLLARSGDAVWIPWQGWSLSTGDYLTTRIVEQVVHLDDLARSIGRGPWSLPTGAQALAIALYELLGCHGFARVDLMLAGEELVVLEANTIPGLTDTSLLPQAADAAGLAFDDLVERILSLCKT